MCPATNFNFMQNVNVYISKNTVNSRAEAFDICHKQFENAILSNNFNYDTLSLHLYAFLASWGMVCRGNYLSQRDYKALIPVVKIACDKKYRTLLDIDVFSSRFSTSAYITLMLDLKNHLANALFGRKANYADDTLLSKIALATLGCVVCYDTKVKANLKSLGYANLFTKNGLNDLLQFANNHIGVNGLRCMWLCNGWR